MTDMTPTWFDPGLCLIGGKWIPAQAGRLELINPSDGTPLCALARGGPATFPGSTAAARNWICCGICAAKKTG